MRAQRGARLGAIGLIAVAACCSVHVLIVLFAAAGVSALTGYFDDIAVFALAVIGLLLTYAFWRRRKAARNDGAERR